MKHKLGVIGFGQMGKNHARVIEKIDSLELIGVFDNNPNSFKDSPVTVFKNLDNLIDECDTLVISSSTNSHFKIFEYCLQKDKNILIEKPISDSMSEIQAIKELVKKTNKFVKIGLLEKYNPVVEYLFSEKLKEVQYINIERLSPTNQINRNQENVLLDLSIHDFSILKKLLGSNFDQISFNFYFKKNYPKDHVNIVGTSDDLNVNISTSKLYQQKVRTVEILTNDSLFKADLIKNSLEITSSKQLSVFDNENSFGHIENATTAYPNIPSKEPLMSQIESFVNDISTNNLESSKTTFFEDLKLHEFLLSQITN